ncbi:MAG: hypothetical protein RIS70_4088 [Planctomycetota bacterium]
MSEMNQITGRMGPSSRRAIPTTVRGEVDALTAWSAGTQETPDPVWRWPRLMLLVLLVGAIALVESQTRAAEAREVPAQKETNGNPDAQEHPAPAPQYWIAAVSVTKYAKLPPENNLQFSELDAKAFVDCMRHGTRAPQDNILQLSDSAELAATHKHIITELPRFIEQAAENDVVLLYMSMHGLQFSKGKAGTYLLPSDVDPESPFETLIDLKWLRQLVTQGTRAKTVLVFLDVGHSGDFPAFETGDVTRPSQKAIESTFEEKASKESGKLVYVLTSCGDKESSVEDPKLKHGVFTYWLVQGLKGAADQNGDASIEMDELHKFVSLRVPRTVRRLSDARNEKLEQHPQRFLCGKMQGNSKVFDLPAQGVNNSLSHTTELVHQLLEDHFRQSGNAGIRKVSVMEFSAKVGDTHELRGSIGSFGKISRDLIERQLIDAIASGTEGEAYAIAGQAAAQSQLQDVNLQQLVSGDLKPLSLSDESGVDAIVTGQFIRRGHTASDWGIDRVQLEISVFDLRSGVYVARFSQTILVNAELWCLLGNSRDAKQELAQSTTQVLKPALDGNVLPPVSSSSITNVNFVSSETQRWNHTALAAHPQRVPDQATMLVNIFQSPPGALTRQRAPWLPADRDHPNQLVFETDEGYELELRLTNQTNRTLAVIVQIDGVNQIGRNVALPRDSWYWTVRPGETKTIDQWLEDPSTKNTQSNFELRGTKLLVTDAPNSVAGKSHYWEQLGEIRVLVFETTKLSTRDAGSTKPGLGIGEGQEGVNAFSPNDGPSIDFQRNTATYVIHYRKFGQP